MGDTIWSIFYGDLWEQETPSEVMVTDDKGFASGVYYYRIEAGEFRDVKKMILLR